VDPLSFARNCVRLFTRQPLIGAEFHRCRTLRIESLERDPLALHLDGEPGGVTPATVRVRPGALRVLAP
jgi:diacylglycerol kinase family enzyme